VADEGAKSSDGTLLVLRNREVDAKAGLHHHDVGSDPADAAIIAASKPGPFQEFYAALLAKGMRPEMARLTLARKIAAITLVVWKKGVPFDAGRRRSIFLDFPFYRTNEELKLSGSNAR
jgi:hypothetical protein